MKLKPSYLYIFAFLLILSTHITLAQNVEEKLKEETTKYEQANSEFMMIEAEKFFLLEDYARALAFLDKALDIDKKNHAAHFKKAEIYLNQNQPKKGLESIKEAINLVSDNKYYYVLGAQLEKADRNLKGTEQFYQMMVENTSDFQAYLIELANTFQSTGSTKKAIDIFENVENLNLDQSMKLVEMYMQEARKKNAKELMEKLLVENPSDQDLKYQYANVLINIGEEKNAITYLEGLPSKSAEMNLMLAVLYAGTGQSNAKYDLLIQSFNNPDASLTEKTLLLGQLMLQSDAEIPIQLVDSLQNMLEMQYPNEALAIENGTYVYTKLSEITSKEQQALFKLKAINRYKQLKDLKPGEFKVWDKVLSYEYEAGDWEALSADGEEALDLYPNQAIFYIYLASAKIKLNDADEANDLLNQALRMTRTNPLLQSQILGKKADVALLENDISAAGKYYLQAIELEAVHPETALAYSAFIENYGVPEKLENGESISDRFTKGNKQNDILTVAKSLYKENDYNPAFILLLQNLPTFENNRNGEALELYGDLFYQLNMSEAAIKYWKKAKEFGGVSDKIDQKIASGKIN